MDRAVQWYPRVRELFVQERVQIFAQSERRFPYQIPHLKRFSIS